MDQVAIGKMLVEQAPFLAAIVLVVLSFLGHLKHQSCENRKEREARDQLFAGTIAERDRLFSDTVMTIHKDNTEQRILSRDALKDVGKAMLENTIATNRLNDRMADAGPRVQT